MSEPPAEQEQAQEPPPSAEDGPPAGGGQGSDTAPGRDDASAPQVDTIDQVIQRLESETERARARKIEAESAFTDRQNRLTALRAVHRDIEATVTAYRAAYSRLTREATAFEDYLTCEEESLRKRLGAEGIEQVRQLSAARDATGERLEQEASAAEASWQQAETTREGCKQDVKKRGDELSEWKKLTATVTARQAELRALREQVTRAAQAGEDGLAYWLLERAAARHESFAEDPRLIEPDEVPQALLRAVQNLADAEQSCAGAERAAAAAKDDRAAALQARDQHQKDSEAELRDALRQIPGAESVTTGERSHA